MRVAIDLDGPCYEFCRTVRYMLNYYRGRNLPPVEKFWTTWWPEQISKDDWDWVFNEGIKLGVFRYGHMEKDTRVGLQALVEMGNELLIVTARPEAAVEDTLDWIDFFYKDIPLLDTHILSNGESKADIDADVLIDDRVENVKEWGRGGNLWDFRFALLYDEPWNQEASWRTEQLHRAGVKRVRGWREVVEWFTIQQNKSNS